MAGRPTTPDSSMAMSSSLGMSSTYFDSTGLPGAGALGALPQAPGDVAELSGAAPNAGPACPGASAGGNPPDADDADADRAEPSWPWFIRRWYRLTFWPCLVLVSAAAGGSDVVWRFGSGAAQVGMAIGVEERGAAGAVPVVPDGDEDGVDAEDAAGSANPAGAGNGAPGTPPGAGSSHSGTGTLSALQSPAPSSQGSSPKSGSGP